MAVKVKKKWHTDTANPPEISTISPWMFPYTPYAYTLLAGPVENRRMAWVARDIFADRNRTVKRWCVRSVANFFCNSASFLVFPFI
jgi:hypothetical protein